MDNILVIQMARMGDFMQTTPLFSAIKKQSGSAKLWVLVDKSIETLASHTPYIDEVLVIDTEKIYKLLKSRTDLMYQYGIIKGKFAFLNNLKFDTVFNLNYSNFTTALSSIPETGKIRGYTSCLKETSIGKDPWFAFFNATVKYPRLTPFNLVDFFCYLFGPPQFCPETVHYSVDAVSANSSVRMLRSENISDEDILIAFQLSTRHEQRQWPVRFFAETAQKLLQLKNVHIVLLGSKRDRKQGDEFNHHVAHLDPAQLLRVHDFISTTTIPELAAILQQSNLLITGDTGTMHLAAAVRCQVLALFIGPARVHHTGPYGHGHWVIQVEHPCSPCIEDKPVCNDFKCCESISPELVFSLSKHILLEESFNPQVLTNIEIVKSDFDKWGVFYKPYVKREVSLSDIRNICYREIGKILIEPDHEVNTDEIDRFIDMFHHDCNNLHEAELKSVLNQATRLMHLCISDPFAVIRAKLDTAMFFWHPWIDYCLELKKNRKDYRFTHGLRTGSKAVKHCLDKLDKVVKSENSMAK